MNISGNITKLILEMLESDGYTEIQRNELAQTLGCVPSQINYVISSRFTPEQGYIVESRRGGGGYIRIRRVELDKDATIMHVINTVGKTLDEKTCRAHILNLNHRNIVDAQTAKLMLAATADTSLRLRQTEDRDEVRAVLFKNMLLTVL